MLLMSRDDPDHYKRQAYASDDGADPRICIGQY